MLRTITESGKNSLVNRIAAAPEKLFEWCGIQWNQPRVAMGIGHAEKDMKICRIGNGVYPAGSATVTAT